MSSARSSSTAACGTTRLPAPCPGRRLHRGLSVWPRSAIPDSASNPIRNSFNTPIARLSSSLTCPGSRENSKGREKGDIPPYWEGRRGTSHLTGDAEESEARAVGSRDPEVDVQQPFSKARARRARSSRALRKSINPTRQTARFPREKPHQRCAMSRPRKPIGAAPTGILKGASIALWPQPMSEARPARSHHAHPTPPTTYDLHPAALRAHSPPAICCPPSAGNPQLATGNFPTGPLHRPFVPPQGQIGAALGSLCARPGPLRARFFQDESKCVDAIGSVNPQLNTVYVKPPRNLPPPE